MYRFLATPRWIATFLTFVLLAAAMVWLGFWQLDRRHQKEAVNAAVTAALTADPTPAGHIIPADTSEAPRADAEWTRVQITGTYAPDKTILIRQRSFTDGVGFEIVVPLIGDDGVTYLIDRGFILGGDTAEDVPEVPATPTGAVSVVGYTKSTYSSDANATKVISLDGYRSVRALNTTVLSTELGVPLAGGYIQAADETPADGAEVAPIDRIPLPELEEGPHLAYAVQWWLFAALTVYGFGYMARREAIDRLLAMDEDDEDDPEHDEPADDGPAGRDELDASGEPDTHSAALR